MPKVASYIVVRDTDITLPDDSGDIDSDEFTFSLPNLTTSTASADRPILSFKVNPLSDDARVVVILNDVERFAQTYSDGPIRVIDEVLDDTHVRASGNTLTVKREGTGTFVISDIVMQYKADV
jgi:hypothetical protein